MNKELEHKKKYNKNIAYDVNLRESVDDELDQTHNQKISKKAIRKQLEAIKQNELQYNREKRQFDS